MRYGIALAAAGPGGDPKTMAELAALAEEAGWDAVFLEDYIMYPSPGRLATFDPWVVMSAMAVATTRIRLGPLVTPITRRRPWKVAMEAVTLDHLSDGRVILGVGAGDASEASFVASGESGEQHVLGRRLDEALAIMVELWEGEPVTFKGDHHRTESLQLAARPLQQPRIPIWVGGDWLYPRVRQRLARWDGCCVYHGKPGTPATRPLDAREVREVLALVRGRRDPMQGFDVCVGGRERDTDWDRERENIRSLAEAGATWWQEWVRPGDLGRTREAVLRGPLR